jgi:ABC-type multidrug transport system fused ATPase/permease subunit
MRAKSIAALRRSFKRLRGLRPMLKAFYRRLLVLSVLGLAASVVDGLAMSFVTLLLVFAVGGTVGMGGGIIGWLLEKLVSITGGSGPLLGTAIVVTIALKATLATANEVFSASARYEIYHRLRLDIFSTYLELPYDRFSSSDRGALFNTLEAETWNVSEAVQCVFRIAINVAPALVFGALILAVDWKVGLGVGVAGAAALGLVSLARGPSRRLSRSAQTQNEALADQAYTAIAGMRTIRILGQERRTRQLFAENTRRSGQIFRKLARVAAVAGPPTEVFFLIIIGVALWIAASQSLPSATLVLIIALLFRLQPYAMRLQADAARLFSLENALVTVSEALLATPVKQNVGSEPFKMGELQFQGVTYRHPGSVEQTLSDVSFIAPAGTFIAIVGPSGAGKSTIANLILRLFEPNDGAITLDRTPIGKIDRASWLKHVTLTGQDSELLSGTIADNLRLGSPDASQHDMEEALNAAGALEFVTVIDQGLATPVGDRGARFSGGQRQRLSLARAVIGKPDLLVLDEATNAVEVATERAMLERVRSFLPKATFIVIAHRSAAAQLADRVIRLEGGRIVAEVGTHKNG